MYEEHPRIRSPCYGGRSLRAQRVAVCRPLSSCQGWSWPLALILALPVPSTRSSSQEGVQEGHRARLSLAFHIMTPTHQENSAPDFGLSSSISLRSFKPCVQARTHNLTSSLYPVIPHVSSHQPKAVALLLWDSCVSGWPVAVIHSLSTESWVSGKSENRKWKVRNGKEDLAK